jgi:hypothetical protein
MNKLTRKDQDMVENDDPFDLPNAGPLLGKLMQPASPELQKPPVGVAGTVEGGYVIPHPRGDEPLVFDQKGFVFHSIAFRKAFVEWGPKRGGPPVGSYPELPADCRWLNSDDSPDGKSGYYRDVNGNSVVQTVYAHGLVATPDGGRIPMTLPFAKSSYAVGNDFAHHAQKLRVMVEVEGEKVELRGAPVGLWRVTSRQEKKDARRCYYVSVVRLVGKLNDPDGPTLDDWRLAMRLRDAFKKGEPWPPEPPEPPAITAQTAPSPAPIFITSGRRAGLRSIETLVDRETAPPIDRVPDGPDDPDDEIRF